MMLLRLFLIFFTVLLVACRASTPTKQAITDDLLTPELALNWQIESNDWRCFPIDETALIELPENFPLAPDDSIWLRLQQGLTLPYIDNTEVEAQLNWYKRNPAYMERVQTRASRYLHHIIEVLHQQDIPFDMALLPIVESAFDPFAYSHGQASGLWQFIPMTGKRFNLKQDWWYDGRRDTVDATLAAANYLNYLYRFFDGDWLLALAAYNSGEGTVRRAINANLKNNKPTDFWHLNLPQETRGYVPRMVALIELFRNPEMHDIKLVELANRPYFAEIELDSQIDLMQASELAGIDIEEIYLLNPGFNRWATPPGKGHKLKLPVETVALFEEGLANLPSNQHITWQRHIVIKGDSLNSIAKKYHGDIQWIKEVNKLDTNIIVVGQTLMIPVASGNLKQYSYSATQRLETKQNSAPNKNLNKIVHTVQSGDTYWSLSRKYKVDMNALARWNNKSPRDALSIDEKLVVWTNSAQTMQRQDKITRIQYRVRQGDSLAKIADKFKVKVNDIVKWNQLDSKRYLQPGQALTLHVNVMNTSGH